MDNPIDALIQLIKGKHKADILIFLNPQPRRFSDVRRHLGETVSERILTSSCASWKRPAWYSGACFRRCRPG
ncbi:hypothetical protein [Hymenobacter koreensis]|uniref:Uncharacterized protein n=1 Tax=Hymenobacter koreensis TaxID=1084523 RepID=A0ABP8JHP6_9BACT